MKSNLFFLLLFGLVVYMIIKSNKQLAATQAAIQSDNQLVAIENPSPVVIVKETNPDAITGPVTVTPVDYLSAYNNA